MRMGTDLASTNWSSCLGGRIGVARILIADGEESFVRSAAATLHLRGHEVVGCKTFDEAIRSIDASMPQLVLVDLRLEGGGGFELLERLRREQRGCGVILTTGGFINHRGMVETYAPYMTPEPHRKVRVNEPKYVVHVAEFFAARRGMSSEGFIAAVDANAERFFGLGSGS